MSLYQIIGLIKKDRTGNSYKTDSKSRILHNENGIGITINKNFTDYIIILSDVKLKENRYYNIYLSEHDNASFSGKLCHNAIMKILLSNYKEDKLNITHFPIKPLFIYANIEVKEYDYDEIIEIYLHDKILEENNCLFKYDGIGGDEITPNGKIYVNMKLFYKKLFSGTKVKENKMNLSKDLSVDKELFSG
jgi:hypothetical protein